MMPIGVLGLPGSGKTTWKHAAEAVSQWQGIEWREFVPGDPAALPALTQSDGFVCVIDITQPLPAAGSQAAQWLTQALGLSDLWVMSFVAQADWDRQLQWQQWLRAQDPIERGQPVPIYRWLQPALPAAQVMDAISTGAHTPVKAPGDASITAPGWQWFDQLNQAWQVWRPAQTQAGRLDLMAFLAGLDAARHNLSPTVLRVSAQVMTTEYANAVAIEGNPFQDQTFAGPEAFAPEQWHARVEGLALPKAWLDDLWAACFHAV